jgi:hypothetical protein
LGIGHGAWRINKGITARRKEKEGKRDGLFWFLGTVEGRFFKSEMAKNLGIY